MEEFFELFPWLAGGGAVGAIGGVALGSAYGGTAGAVTGLIAGPVVGMVGAVVVMGVLYDIDRRRSNRAYEKHRQMRARRASQ